MNDTQAISGRVTGNDQHVGFRAMIMKQAIAYNLSGFTRNLPDDVVTFTLQGRPKRLADAVAAIRQGTAKSSGIQVATEAAAVDPGRTTFTVYGWTSTSRDITTPYDLVFRLRADDGKIDPHAAQAVWRGILQATLQGDDLARLGADG